MSMADPGSAIDMPEFGVHLPIVDFSGVGWSVSELAGFARQADDLGYRYLCANDHLLFSRPWLDGLTALAAVVEASGDMTLATTVALPVVRGPAPLAKTLAAIDVLSGGRLVVGVGTGSSARDYEAVGLDRDERWKRLEESTQALRSLLNSDAPPVEGEFYSTSGVTLEPAPAQVPGPPIWIGSWGSKPGIRRVARLADGWLASGYNTTPERFDQGLARLQVELSSQQRDPTSFPNGLSTLWTYVTESSAEEQRLLETVLSPLVRRPVEELRKLSLPIGSAEVCAERLTAFADAGVQRMFIWPLADPLEQIQRFQARVAPLVRSAVGR
jgi:alkanesulfonate monooxygenase SsuD/methylene tetrahydromethanopterin reductase-like flavin-dependent oxidoreductase (luciferase family)